MISLRPHSLLLGGGDVALVTHSLTVAESTRKWRWVLGTFLRRVSKQYMSGRIICLRAAQPS